MARIQPEVARLCNTSWTTPSDLLSERHLQRTHSAVYILAVALGCISLALSVACLIFNALSRNNRVVKMSSPRLNIVIACGGILGSCVCMMLAADYFLDTSMAIGHLVCQARAALLAVSFTLVFGPMVGKTWRVNQIFRLAGAKRVIIKDVRLVAFTTILLCVDIIWTLLWNFLDPLEFTSIVVFDKGREISASTSILSTSSGTMMLSSSSPSVSTVAGCASGWSSLWLAGVLLYKAPFLVWGLREAWWTRGHILPAINDSACLAYSSITTAAAMLVYLMVDGAFRKWPTVVYACALASIWISVMMAISFVFIPKVRAWRSTPKGERARVSISSISNSMAFLQSFENIESELGHAHSEIDSLKNFIKQKESDMDALQTLLSNAENSLAQIQLAHSDLDGPRGSPLSAGEREKWNWKSKGDKLKDRRIRDGHKEDDGGTESAHWSEPDCGGQSSSADEGGVTSEEVNSSLDMAMTGSGRSCCLHGQACQAGAEQDNEKEEGSCWYLPSDRGYAPAHLLASTRGRHHHRHHHHHRRRRRPGLSAPSGHSFSRTRRTVSTSTPNTHSSIGHRTASSCGSSSVFTKGSASNKNVVLNNNNMYVHYAKRGGGGGGGLPARRHSHGSIYTQQQHEKDLPRRLFDYSASPDRRQYDTDADYFSLDRIQPVHRHAISCQHHYDSEDTAQISRTSGHHTEPESRGGPSHPRFSIPKHRKRRRSSTQSVQSTSSYTKLSKLRSDLNDAMAISRRLMGTWSVDSVPVSAFVGSGQSPHTSAIQETGKRMRPKSAEKSRRQTVIGIQGIADSILESYNFQRTEDNHSFVYDCITPRRYANSPNKIGKNSPSCSNRKMSKTEHKENNGVDGSTGVFSFNFYNRPNQVPIDFQSIEAGFQHSRIELASFEHEDKKMNGFENPNYTNLQTKCFSNNAYTSFVNNINHPPSEVGSNRSQDRSQDASGGQHFLNSLETSNGISDQIGSSNRRYEKDMSAFCEFDNGFKGSRTAIGSGPPKQRKSDGNHLVFLPPQNVSIQSMLNQAHFDMEPRENHDINNAVNLPNILVAHSTRGDDLRRSPGMVSETASVRGGLPLQPQQLNSAHLQTSEELCDAGQRRSPCRALSSQICIRNALREEARGVSPQPPDKVQMLNTGGLFDYTLEVQGEGPIRRNDSFA